MNPSIRSLNKGDLNEITYIHLKAFPGRALSLLGAETIRRYYEWQLLGPHDVVALGIYLDDRMAGFCFSGVFNGALSGFLKKNRNFLFWRVLTHPWLITNPLFRQRVNFAQSILHRGKATLVSQPVAREKSFGILSIAIDPALQGRGLGKQLSAEVEAIATERGFPNIHLTVDTDNNQAISFYENTGWYRSVKPAEMWGGHMIKDLSSKHE